jgi:hypothetical protein
MKNIFYLALFFSFFLVASCESPEAGNNKGSAEETMNSFIEKVSAKDFEGAKEFASNRTDKTLETLNRAQIMFKEMNKEDKNKMSFRGVDFSQKVSVKCTSKDDKTTCECCEEVTGNCQSIAVIQENGKWLVDQPKESNVE